MPKASPKTAKKAPKPSSVIGTPATAEPFKVKKNPKFKVAAHPPRPKS